MNWKLKALGQSAVSMLPYAPTLNYWAQKFITRAHENVVDVVEDRVEKARWFLEQFALHVGAALGDAQFFEFGAGWNLAGALALYCLGVNRQIVVDMMPCARLELVNGVIAKLDGMEGLCRRPGGRLDALSQMEERFGIVYRAPADAPNSGLAARSIDCITNTYTMEHIPPVEMREILRECHRVLRPGGIFLALIDYQDHYFYRDTRISVYNFLQYSERQWRWFNSSLHYQNRLRHCQYLETFASCGFEVAYEELKRPSTQHRARLESLALSAEFRSFSLEDLEVLGSQIACRARRAECLIGQRET